MLIGPFPRPAGQTCEDVARHCATIGLRPGGCSEFYFSCEQDPPPPPATERERTAGRRGFPWVVAALGVGFGMIAIGAYYSGR